MRYFDDLKKNAKNKFKLFMPKGKLFLSTLFIFNQLKIAFNLFFV